MRKPVVGVAVLVLSVGLIGCSGSPAATSPAPANVGALGPTPSLPLVNASPTIAVGAPSRGPAGVIEDVDIGATTLHLTCLGEAPPRTPPIVIETGLGGSAQDWSAVQATLAATTRVCVYDRAGLGLSGSSSQAVRTSADLVDDLHRLLQAAKIDGPYLFVGHSTGAWQVSLYAATYPDEVSGAVYVDPRSPLASVRYLAVLGKPAAGESAGVTAYRDDLNGFEGDPAKNLERVDLVASAAEAAAVETGDGTLFGSKPVLVLKKSEAVDASEFADLPSETAAAMLAALERNYERYLAQTTNGTLTIVADTSHDMINDRPDAIVAGVADMLRTIAGG